AAAVLTAGAAGIEMLACGTELVLRHFNPGSTTGVGATVFLGRLRLWGGALATAGGSVLAVYDWSDGAKAEADGMQVLARAYRLRALVGMAMAASQFSLAIAAARPMIKLMAERAARTRFDFFYNVFARMSALFARKAVVLFLRRVLLRGTLLTIAITVAIAIFDDDALKKWCKQTLYRGPKYRNEKGFDDASTELGALFGALSEVV
ncbi:hypothetical protein OCO52_26030, partial [Achromobacter mucicolens]